MMLFFVKILIIVIVLIFVVLGVKIDKLGHLFVRLGMMMVWGMYWRSVFATNTDVACIPLMNRNSIINRIIAHLPY